MPLALDHLLWAVPDLDAGMASFAALTGVVPAPGGTHPGFGTRNALVALDRGAYLEIIAPDPAQPHAAGRFAAIVAHPAPGLRMFAVGTERLDGYARAAEHAGLEVTGPVRMGRTRPDGVRLDWACLYPDHPTLGQAIPFAIDWGRSPHPSATAPRGCRLDRFVVLHPDPAGLATLLAALGVAVTVLAAPRASLLAELDTPRGRVVLAGP